MVSTGQVIIVAVSGVQAQITKQQIDDARGVFRNQIGTKHTLVSNVHCKGYIMNACGMVGGETVILRSGCKLSLLQCTSSCTVRFVTFTENMHGRLGGGSQFFLTQNAHTVSASRGGGCRMPTLG